MILLIAVETEAKRPLACIQIVNVAQEDFEQLAEIRRAAMRDSLERVGRYDARSSRTRLLVSFAPEFTRLILMDGKVAGVYATRRDEVGVELEHFCILPRFQNRGIGSQVLQLILLDADLRKIPVFVTALKQSGSNRFYRRHGFVPDGAGECENY